MANRYWVASTASNWNNTANWSTTSGGSSGASVPGASDDVIFDGNGTGDCTLNVNSNILSLDAQSAYTGTFSLSSFTLTISGNATADSNLAVSTGTLSCQGDVDIYPLQASGGTLTLNGSAQVLTLGANSANVVTDLNIDGSTVTTANNGPSRRVASGAWVVNNGGSFTYSGGLGCNSISVGSGSFVTQTANTTTVSSGGGILQNDGYIDIVSLTHSNKNNGTYYWDAGDYRNTALTLHGNNETHTFGSGLVEINTLTINAGRSSRSATIANTTNNPNFEFSGSVNLAPTTGTIVWNAGTGIITLDNTAAQSISLNGQTVEAVVVSDNSVNAITLADNVTTPYVHDCANLIDENGYTVTTTGTDPSPCSTGARYWVGLVDTDYENTGNWSTTSGGLGGASVPVGSNDIYFDGNGVVNCTLGASRSVGGFDVDTAYGSTFNMNGYDFRIGGDCDLGSDSSSTVGITFQKGTGTLLFAGTTNLNFARASWGGSSSTIEWTGTHTLLTFYNGGDIPGTQNITGGSLTINPWIANSWPYEWQQGTIDGTLTANNNIEFMGGGSRDVSISDNATIAGTAKVNFRGNTNCDLTIGSNVTFSIATVEFECYRLTLHGDFVADNDVLIDRWTTTSDQFTFSGNNVFSVGGDLTVSSTQGGSWNHTSQDVFYTIKGDVIYSGSMTWNAGNGSITFDNTSAQSIDFNGETIEAVIVSDVSTSTITLTDNFTTPYVHDCDNLIDLNGFTITETGTDPSPCVSSGATRSLINGFTSPLISGGLVQ